MFHPDGVRPDESQYSAHYMLRDVVALARRLRPGVPLDALPRMCVIADAVTEYELAQLFRGADAFVLPTRGEGWGLPTLQAMSMGLPTVSTNWGGSVDFTTPETAFLVEVDAVEEVPLDSPYGHRPGLKWGQPSLAHLRQLMHYVYDHRAMAAAVGRRARRHVVAHFDDNVVVDAVTARFDEIARSLRGKQFGLGHGIYFPDG
jgi:glycosyltransferase involved in cell wall biosynthesis